MIGFEISTHEGSSSGSANAQANNAVRSTTLPEYDDEVSRDTAADRVFFGTTFLLSK